MSRFRQAVESTVPYTEVRRLREDELYIAPEDALEQGIERAIDDAPALEPLGPSDRAAVSYQHLKGRR